MKPALENIAKAISNLRQESPKPFVDVSGLPHLFHGNVLSACLEESGARPHQIMTYGPVIEERAYRIFAVLVRVEQPHLIGTFIEHQIYDDKLPLIWDTKAPLPFTNRLSPQFFDIQYEFLPHKFERGRHYHIHNDKIILPFQSVERCSDLDGSFGSISKVIIHSSYHNWIQERVSTFMQ